MTSKFLQKKEWRKAFEIRGSYAFFMNIHLTYKYSECNWKSNINFHLTLGIIDEMSLIGSYSRYSTRSKASHILFFSDYWKTFYILNNYFRSLFPFNWTSFRLHISSNEILVIFFDGCLFSILTITEFCWNISGFITDLSVHLPPAFTIKKIFLNI